MKLVQGLGPLAEGRHAKGTLIISEGAVLAEWILIDSGVVSLCARVAGMEVAVATLWRGDVIGWDSPLGREQARFDVRAMGEVRTLQLPAGQAPQVHAQMAGATEARLQQQIFMRLAGNGLQRLVSVLATLAAALTEAAQRVPPSLALPLVQGCLGDLSGLSRRQTWIYLGQLAQAGWVRTTRTRVLLDGLDAWLALPAEIEREGLACIATLELCTATLERLSLVSAEIQGLTPAARSSASAR